jgi:hypothetical protein
MSLLAIGNRRIPSHSSRSFSAKLSALDQSQTSFYHQTGDNLGDCRDRICRIAPDCCLTSRRDGGRIASYVTVVVTTKPSQKTGNMLCSLTEIALDKLYEKTYPLFFVDIMGCSAIHDVYGHILLEKSP